MPNQITNRQMMFVLKEHLTAVVPGWTHRAHDETARGAGSAAGRIHRTRLAVTAALRDWAR